MSTDPPSKETLDLLDSVTSLSDALKSGQQGAREGLLDVCTKLVSHLSHPSEQLLRLYWAQPTHLAVIRLGIDFKLFHALKHVSGQGEGATTADIASHCSGNPDPELVARMLRHLAAMGTVRETGPNTFASTAMTNAYTETAYEDSILFLVDFFQNVHQSTPAYFRENGFQPPKSGVDGLYQYTFNCKGSHLFEHFEKSVPEQGKRFASMMDLWSQGRPRWFDPEFYPVQERLIAGVTQDSEFFLVDVGGGTGHDIEGLKQAFPSDISGKLVLQDRPEIVELAQVDSSIVKQPHDFLTEQPVKGARAYFLHSIIQDWSDEVNTQILKSIVPAMKKGYSKVLINDYVVPDQGAKWPQTALDWELMASLGSRHRTQADHEKLYKGAGLKINGIWRHPHSLDSVIELELA
ncbi:O-methyltransferase [Periconia macrospinosa]|uniref:O-methyltransferase n=1 Tax=Periconia macrospinosa TaxID=97972 RepID=A0A2V1E1L3_9PLEO|nr:O-methyltransferase [Periconia macrospinosa]